MRTMLVVALLAAGLAFAPSAHAECMGGGPVCHVVDCPEDPNQDRPCELRALDTANRILKEIAPTLP